MHCMYGVQRVDTGIGAGIGGKHNPPPQTPAHLLGVDVAHHIRLRLRHKGGRPRHQLIRQAPHRPGVHHSIVVEAGVGLVVIRVGLEGAAHHLGGHVVQRAWVGEKSRGRGVIEEGRHREVGERGQ